MSHASNVCNGPLITGMYNVKPYYDNDMPVELPQCMYTLNSVYDSEMRGDGESNVPNMVCLAAQFTLMNGTSKDSRALPLQNLLVKSALRIL